MTMGTKKSLFSKPAFSKSASAKVQSGTSTTDLFSRADSSYSAIIEEEEKRIKKRKVKATQKVEEDGKAIDLIDSVRKRRHISISDPSSEDESDLEQPERNKVRLPGYSPAQVKHTSQTNPALISSTKPFTYSDHKVLELSDDDDSRKGIHASDEDPDITFVSSTNHVQHLQTIDTAETHTEAEEDEEDKDESDDEFAEIARQARETARRKQESQAERATYSFQANSMSTSQNGQYYESPRTQAINIHVESPIPGVERKTIKRRLDQRLRQVRLIWCDANGFSEEESTRIILMFRGQRVYDVSTPESLGISVNNQGEAHVRGDDPLNPLEPSGDIVMEAINEDQQKAYTSAWLEEHGRGQAENDDEKLAETQPPQQEPVLENVKIICRAKSYPDFKLAVKKVRLATPQVGYRTDCVVYNDSSYSRSLWNSKPAC